MPGSSLAETDQCRSIQDSTYYVCLLVKVLRNKSKDCYGITEVAMFDEVVTIIQYLVKIFNKVVSFMTPLRVSCLVCYLSKKRLYNMG